MITVLASITVKAEAKSAFIEIFKNNIEAVKAEEGCIEYYPTVDFETAVPIQDKNPAVVTIVEQWKSIEALEAHLQMPHMIEYKEKVQNMVTDLSIKILQAA